MTSTAASAGAVAVTIATPCGTHAPLVRGGGWWGGSGMQMCLRP